MPIKKISIIIFCLYSTFITYKYVSIDNDYDKLEKVYHNLLVKKEKLLNTSNKTLENFEYKNEIYSKNINELDNVSKNLKKQLDKKDRKIATLNKNLKFFSDLFKKNIFLDKLENMNGPEITATVSSFLNIKEDEQPTQMTPKEFAIKLFSIATNLDDDIDKESLSTQLSFANRGGKNIDNEFNASTKRITTAFDSSQYGDKKILTKWYNEDSGELLLFDFYEINPNSKENFIWLENKEGWKKGRYRVEMYSPNNSLKLISSNEFDVR